MQRAAPSVGVGSGASNATAKEEEEDSDMVLWHEDDEDEEEEENQSGSNSHGADGDSGNRRGGRTVAHLLIRALRQVVENHSSSLMFYDGDVEEEMVLVPGKIRQSLVYSWLMEPASVVVAGDANTIRSLKKSGERSRGRKKSGSEKEEDPFSLSLLEEEEEKEEIGGESEREVRRSTRYPTMDSVYMRTEEERLESVEQEMFERISFTMSASCWPEDEDEGALLFVCFFSFFFFFPLFLPLTLSHFQNVFQIQLSTRQLTDDDDDYDENDLEFVLSDDHARKRNKKCTVKSDPPMSIESQGIYLLTFSLADLIQPGSTTSSSSSKVTKKKRKRTTSSSSSSSSVTFWARARAIRVALSLSSVDHLTRSYHGIVENEVEDGEDTMNLDL